MGRPTDYTLELAHEICDAIASHGVGIKRLCEAHPEWPTRETIMRWRRTREDFKELYMDAKREQVETLVDECLEIADNTDFDTVTRTTKSGDEYEAANNEWINRSRLRIDTRKWIASKLVPKLYGDKQGADESEVKSFMEQIRDKL